ncbi:TPA: ATP-binding protein [Streptococcus pyogenes]|uniref:ATP-binding protein n=1 Tax=Streptococcus pyogenes TaxID=1314 RepID=UPI00109D2B18|nr:ATP-binding protein [Streptococcus pyogenes]VGS04788.1 Yga2G [Streptococcus pyogenes]VGS08455.1 Yga2G [Streptococcus pyogenes]VGV17709.1 putative OLD family ATP-dependent endonuclease [Streptococcus pyogenes]VHB52566.1 putative OLD family ATP-dependent endonuclease [Streptococcus pyogenes]VHC52085.1 putative OLD family ATP-dependent endonuclease [Streptococcus pyogenes]
MRLKKLKLKNFRGYRDEMIVDFDALTAFIGKNDAGKSTILEALEIFFNNKLVVCEREDLSVGVDEDSIYITCIFDELPNEIIVDTSSKTSLQEENLLNSDGDLEIKKIFKCSSAKPKPTIKIVCNHPVDDNFKDLLLLKQGELKKRAVDLGIDENNYDKRSNVSIRKAILDSNANLTIEKVELEVDKEDAKKVYGVIETFLPIYALFQSDRSSSDSDKEIADPMSVAVSQALQELKSEIDKIKREVQQKAIETAGRTLAKLQEMDEELAASLIPEFKSEPKFDSLFKLSIKSDDDISINKRGSGVRRLILLNFFRAEAERKLSETERNQSIIYAFEEPETSQHPSHQKLLIEAFLELASKENTQIILTTHTPALGGLLPISSLRLVEKSKNSKVSNGSDKVLQRITETLGVLPDPISNETKALILVEGKTDIIFFSHLCKILKESGEIDKTFQEAKIALVPTGGCDNLKSWITMKTVDQFSLPYGIFLDSDKLNATTTTKNTSTVDKNVKQGRLAFCTRKREAENYLHPDLFSGCVNISDFNDVKQEVKSYDQTNESKVLEKNWPKMTIEQLHQQEKYLDENNDERFELTEIVKAFLGLVES